jgi:hypothetical protein
MTIAKGIKAIKDIDITVVKVSGHQRIVNIKGHHSDDVTDGREESLLYSRTY